MNEKKEAQPRDKPPTPDFQSFEKAVEMLAHLNGEKRVIIHLSARYTVRIVSDSDQFKDGLATALDAAQLDGKRASVVIAEICNLLQICLYARSKAHAVHIVLREGEFTSEPKKKGPAEEIRKAETERKVSLVFDKLVTSTLQERALRLASSTSPLFQDVDVEIISERKSELDGKDVKIPFIRLKLRYTDKNGGLPFFFPPSVSMDTVSTGSFELECDETDITMMIRRLQGAKNLLLQTLSSKNQVAS